MALKKKSTTRRRKPGAKSPGRKRKARIKSLPKSDVTTQNAGSYIAISGVRFSKSSCHSTKTAAKKAAETKRATGSLARVRKNTRGGYCVFTRSGRAR